MSNVQPKHQTELVALREEHDLSGHQPEDPRDLQVTTSGAHVM